MARNNTEVRIRDDMTPRPILRRKFLRNIGAAVGATAFPRWSDARPGFKRVAAIITHYTHNSHADIIVGRLLESHTLDGRGTWPKQGWPRLELASMYVDQFPAADKSRALAAEFNVPLCASVADALTIGGPDLAVDGVLIIAEHGDYPLSETGQIAYPRRKFFEETAAVFRRSGRSVPVFMDKHLAWNWPDAKWIYDTARELKVPLMAGSTVPITWRHPAIEMNRGARATEAVGCSFGPLETYGFHGLEALQCLAERRRGGETGVRAVQCLEGDAVWQARDAGRIDGALLEACLAVRERPLRPGKRIEDGVTAAAFLIDYTDGFRAVMLHGNGGGFINWIVAWREEGRGDLPATLFWTQEARPLGHFGFLVQGIEEMIYSGKPTWPAERTLLTTGILAAGFQSRKEGGARIETPHLAIAYEPTFTWTDPPAPPPGRPFTGP